MFINRRLHALFLYKFGCSYWREELGYFITGAFDNCEVVVVVKCSREFLNPVLAVSNPAGSMNVMCVSYSSPYLLREYFDSRQEVRG
jgi:hypothetical protein